MRASSAVDRPIALAPPRPSPLQVNPDGIPFELKSLVSWVCWSLETNEKGRWTKVPYTPTGINASTTKPETWSPFEAALAAYHDPRRAFDGIGLVMVDGLAGIDLDHVVAGAMVEPWAAGIADRFSGTYIERSPGGEGLRIFLKGKPARCGKGGPDNRLEVYDRTSPRYLTVTGHQWQDSARGISSNQEALDWLHGQYMVKDKPKPHPLPSMQFDSMADGEILAKAMKASNGAKFSRLLSGDADGYPSESEADLAFCNMLAFWTRKDSAQMDRIFRASGLMRSKWDERHGEQTYGELTLRKALSDTTETYSRTRLPAAQAIASPSPDAAPRGQAEQAAPDTPLWPVPLDLAALASIDPQPPQFIIDPLLPSGYASLFAAHGGSGKSSIALLQAVCIALGIPFAGIDTQRRRVLYLSCEDRERVLHWRLSRICRHLGVNMADLSGWLDIIDLVGHESILWVVEPRSGASYTAAYAELAARIKTSKSQVIYVDGIADVYGGEENSRSHVKQFVNALVGLIDPDEGALILIGHVNKQTATVGDGSEGYSGSTGWHNSVRARWYLYPETEQDEDGGKPTRTGRLVFELQKSNLGLADETIAWRWDESAGMLLPEESRQSNFDRVQQQRDERRGILRAMKACADSGIPIPAATTGRRTAFHVLSAQPDFSDSMRSGKPSVRRFWREIEHLRAIKHVEDSSIRRADRHIVTTLVLTPEGVRACGQ